MSGDVAPFEKNRHAINQRVPLKESFIVKPHDIVILNVMPKVLGPNIFNRAVAGPADPTEQTTQLHIVSIDRKQGVVGTFVDQIGRDDHGVPEEDHAG